MEPQEPPPPKSATAIRCLLHQHSQMPGMTSFSPPGVLGTCASKPLNTGSI